MSHTQRMSKLIDQLSDSDEPAMVVLAVRMRYCLVDIIRETLDLRDEKIALLELVKEIVKHE